MNLSVARALSAIGLRKMTPLDLFRYEMNETRKLERRENRCKHDWESGENQGKRFCKKCDREEWLFSRRASLSQPSLSWERMGPLFAKTASISKHTQ